jgi:hypothetical protein
VNPLTYRALELGHPEEPLAALLAVAAVVAAHRLMTLQAGLLLGAAIATKQWALLALGPVLLAGAPETRRRTAGVVVATALVLFAPVAAGNTERFRDAVEHAASPVANATPTNVWWPAAKVVPDPNLAPGSERRMPPETVKTLARWLVIAFAFGAAALLLAYRREPGLASVLGLTALIFLARCLLDPYTFSYHHWPFLTALAAYETVGRKRFPALAVLAAAALWYMSYELAPGGDADALLSFYLAWTLPFVAVLAWLTIRSVPAARTRSP